TIYTDASKTQTGAGAAASTTNLEKLVKLPEHCSIFTGEIIAIKQTLQISEILPENQIMIVSDLLSASKALKQLYPKNPILREIRECFKALESMNKKIYLLWVPSHIGIQKCRPSCKKGYK
ncbi:hypothetical protein HHI36_001698, partial [Cryptolaemus montrouzieri]